MQTDTATRLLLAGILVCLIVLIVQGYGSGAGTPGRYLMMATRAGTPILIRMDTATGRVWKQELRGGRGRWVEFQEPAEEEASETAMAPPESVEAPAPREARIAAPREQTRTPATPDAGPVPNLEEVHYAAVTTGPYDVFIWLGVESAERLGNLLHTRIGVIDGVQNTQTLRRKSGSL